MYAAPSIFWFYNDLRLADNDGLTQAATRGPVVPLYILDDSDHLGGASKWWLHEALADLGKNCAAHRMKLILKCGEPLVILRQLIEETGAKRVVWSRRYEPEIAARDAKIGAALQKDGIEVSVTPGFLLFEPENIRTQSGGSFKVFTPFQKPASPRRSRARLCRFHLICAESQVFPAMRWRRENSCRQRQNGQRI